MRSRSARHLALAGVLATLATPAGALGAEPACDGDECQGPPPAPEEVIPATAVVVGPENPPVRFPKGQGAKKDNKQGKKGDHKGGKGRHRGAKR